MELRSPITAIKGIGSRTEQRMQKIGVYTVGDILLHYPREYVQYKPPQKPSEIRQEGHHAVIGRVMSVPVLKRTNRMELVQTKAGDLSGTIELVWFRMPYMKSKLKLGEIYIFYGKAKKRAGPIVWSSRRSIRSSSIRKKCRHCNRCMGKRKG